MQVDASQSIIILYNGKLHPPHQTFEDIENANAHQIIKARLLLENTFG